ncbi:MAG: ABC transporter substrate-binding protein [Raoultibacter sp.]
MVQHILVKKAGVVALASVLAAGLMLPLSGCASTAQNSEPTASAKAAETSAYTFTDDLGNEVTVSNPQRVVACMGSFANIWELAGGTLIGATDDAFADYGIAEQGIAKMGDFTAPNLEQIIAATPDFVIMTGSSSGRNGATSQTDLKEGLTAAGIPVAYFNVTTFDDYLRMLKTCCAITGQSERYQENGQAVADAIAQIKEKVPAGTTQSTALLMTTYSGGTRVQNSKSMTGAMLADLRVKNLADENKSLLKDFSLESVIELDPDFIFVVPMGNDDTAAMANLKQATQANPAWGALSAVTGGRYITLDKGLFLYKPNALWAQSYQVLFDDLYA